jgi:hypothetical protein
MYADIEIRLFILYCQVKRLLIPNKDNSYRPILLRKLSLVVYTVILFLVNTFGGLVGIPQAMASSITPANIISLTNQQRSAAGLNTLNNNAKLAAAAQAKANNMFELQYWDHFGPNGESPWMFISQAGYVYVYAGENLAKGFRTAEGVHEAWMASPTHRDNIMSGNYKDIGVAVVEGNLLGTDTILVVQMFGNLTSETLTPSTPPTVKSTPVPKPVVKESGQIKSIRITYPKTGDLLPDSNVNIKGETENIFGDYTVEILNGEEVLGETNSNEKNWDFDKGSDWSEGEHTLQAQIKGEGTKSDEVKFIIDSTPPVIEQSSITVNRGEEIVELRFDYPSDVSEIQFVTGDKTFDLELSENGEVVFTVLLEDVGESAVLMVSDEVGNILELDISEYFLEGEEEKEEPNFWNNVMLSLQNLFGTTDGISLSIVSIVFILLTLQVYVLWKKGKLGRNAGELFTVGAWWLIILIGVFKGFGGLII